MSLLLITRERTGASPGLDFKKQREQARRESIVRIARHSEELGDYDSFIPPEHEMSDSL